MFQPRRADFFAFHLLNGKQKINNLCALWVTGVISKFFEITSSVANHPLFTSPLGAYRAKIFKPSSASTLGSKSNPE